MPAILYWRNGILLKDKHTNELGKKNLEIGDFFSFLFI